MADQTKTTQIKPTIQIKVVVLTHQSVLVTESPESESLKDQVVQISLPEGSQPLSPGTVMELTVRETLENKTPESLLATNSQVLAPKSPAVKLPIKAGPTLKAQLEDQAILVDVRSPGEFAQGHLAGAINLPVQQLHKKIQTQVTGKDEPIIVYCQTGHRSGLSAKLLKLFGYKTVIDIGGLNAFTGTLVK